MSMQRLPRGSNDGRLGMVVAVGFNLVPLHTSTSMYLHGKPREICCSAPTIRPADQGTYMEHGSCCMSIPPQLYHPSPSFAAWCCPLRVLSFLAVQVPLPSDVLPLLSRQSSLHLFAKMMSRAIAVFFALLSLFATSQIYAGKHLSEL